MGGRRLRQMGQIHADHQPRVHLRREVHHRVRAAVRTVEGQIALPQIDRHAVPQVPAHPAQPAVVDLQRGPGRLVPEGGIGAQDRVEGRLHPRKDRVDLHPSPSIRLSLKCPGEQNPRFGHRAPHDLHSPLRQLRQSHPQAIRLLHSAAPSHLTPKGRQSPPSPQSCGAAAGPAPSRQPYSRPLSRPAG